MSVNEPVTFLYAVTRKLTKKRNFWCNAPYMKIFHEKFFGGGIHGTLAHLEFSAFKFSIFKCISFG